MVSQINTPSYLLQLKLILGFGGSETWSVSYLALLMFFNICKGPNSKQNGHESCNLRSHLLSVTLDRPFPWLVYPVNKPGTELDKDVQDTTPNPEGLNLAKQ